MLETLTIVTPPAVMPVTAEELKLYLRLPTDVTTEDDLLDNMIEAATMEVQNYLHRTLITTTYKLTLDGLPAMRGEQWWDGVREGAISELHGARDYIRLQMPNVQSVTSVKYFDRTDTEQTFSTDNYRVDTVNGRVTLKNGKTWMTDLRDSQAIEITYVAGYGATSASVPAAIIHAIKRLAAKMYESRGCDCELDNSIAFGLQSYRLMGALYNG